jgi:hypothetical protein
MLQYLEFSSIHSPAPCKTLIKVKIFKQAQHLNMKHIKHALFKKKMHLTAEYSPSSTFNENRITNDTTFDIKLNHNGPSKEYFVRTRNPMKSSMRAYLEQNHVYSSL